MKLSNKVYDCLKWITSIVIPSALALLAGLNSAWGWNLPIEAISISGGLIITFLGATMSFSSQLYYKDGGDNNGD